jgi:hypothetical protein
MLLSRRWCFCKQADVSKQPLVFAQLVFAQLVFAQLVCAQLVFAQLVFAQLVFAQHVDKQWNRGPVFPDARFKRLPLKFPLFDILVQLKPRKFTVRDANLSAQCVRAKQIAFRANCDDGDVGMHARETFCDCTVDELFVEGVRPVAVFDGEQHKVPALFATLFLHHHEPCNVGQKPQHDDGRVGAAQALHDAGRFKNVDGFLGHLDGVAVPAPFDVLRDIATVAECEFHRLFQRLLAYKALFVAGRRGLTRRGIRRRGIRRRGIRRLGQRRRGIRRRGIRRRA